MALILNRANLAQDLSARQCLDSTLIGDNSSIRFGPRAAGNAASQSREDDFSKATGLYEGATALDPHDAFSWYYLSECYASSQRASEAARARRTALAIDPAIARTAGSTPAVSEGGKPAARPLSR
jgi:cytochrome c-type biogenesis protein CcmH/NrfG